ncbi:aromatic amino acid transaminase [Gynuella sunshinyii]|uniref:Aspartate/tyrosine/aromatic aminotransferase n=1 Tax=Gynuella sunshinyii YC6258 TaxID=1445510 RepID=A0A0C5VTA5_9GAMM|nr:amino acid aminotransferase [Gynuella sunshinyii]AJQ97912.1 aspartate/tyrosine/aromatic aminotransferase [Gynuella sunshinyii YC6258]
MFELLSEPRKDPILSLSAAYKDDPRTNKLDLGIGVYRNNDGITPVMAAVKAAEQYLLENQPSKAYVGLAGDEIFNEAITHLLLAGTEAEHRAIALQTPGASGALRMLADLIRQTKPDTTVWISDPGYVNHRPIMEAAGLKVRSYPYFDPNTKTLNEAAMLAQFAQLGPDDILLLHGCCHNPTGVDLEFSHWQQIASMSQKQGFLPFIDIAYQGFGDGLEQDLKGLQHVVDQVEEVLITTSCSKNFGLYRERTGAAVLVAKDKQTASKARSRMFEIVRANYTMPPDHGSAIVAHILTTPELKQQWLQELNTMLTRIKGLRTSLRTQFQAKTGEDRFAFFEHHKGMFSVTGLSTEQINRLREEFGIYIVGDSRVNVAGMQEQAIPYLIDSFLAVGA